MRRKRPGKQQCALPDTANQWFASSQTWQMEHSGVLQLGGKVLPLTGVMRLNLREKEILISIMSGFGLKLLAMKVRPETQEILYASPAADANPALHPALRRHAPGAISAFSGSGRDLPQRRRPVRA